MRTAVVTAVLAIVLAGCSGQGEQGTGQASPPPAGAAPPAAPPPAPAPPPGPPPGVGVHLDTSPTLEQIRMRGKLLVGLRGDARQFATRDGNGGYRGFDVEIARRLAQGLGLDPETQVSYRMLPPSLQGAALSGGSVDLQIGGVQPGAPGATAVGPYALVGSRPEYVGIKAGDDVFAQQLGDAVHAAVTDGSWQRAYDTTLAPAGVQAEPPR